MKRGDVPHPRPWVLRVTSLRTGKGWVDLEREVPHALDEAWVQITGNPRHHTERQHRLRGALATHRFKGTDLEVWQYEVTSGARLWYLIDDATRTLWLYHAGTGHPKATECPTPPHPTPPHDQGAPVVIKAPHAVIKEFRAII